MHETGSGLGPSRQVTRKILLITSYGPSLTNFRWPLVCDLVRAGHALVTSAPGIPDNTRHQVEAIGAVVEETPMSRTGLNPLRDVVYMVRLMRLLRRHRPDLLLSFTIKPNIWGAFAAASVGVPSVAVLTGLGYAFTGSQSRKQKLTQLVATRLYRFATGLNRHVVFQNPDDRDDFIAAGGLADRSKAVLMNGSGVDLDHYARVPLPDEPIFLMIARLIGNKGVREYAAAVARVKKERPDARFLLVGDWDEGHDGIPRHEVDRWIADGMEYLGPMADVREAIAQASVFVLPSYREGTPRSVLEAMAMGRGIITSDAPGCRETVIDGENGLLVPARDVDVLVAAMARLVDDSALRQRFGERSWQIARTRYDSRRVNAKLMGDIGIGCAEPPETKSGTA